MRGRVALPDDHEVAVGVSYARYPFAPWLVDRLLDDVDAGRAQAFNSCIAIVGVDTEAEALAPPRGRGGIATDAKVSRAKFESDVAWFAVGPGELIADRRPEKSR